MLQPLATPRVLLPPEGRMALATASNEAKRITNELAREIFMREAIDKIKRTYPQYFSE